MDRSLFIAQSLLAAALLAVHYVAFQHDLYWHYLWLDIPMHFLGGFWAALVTVWFLRRTPLPLSFMNVLVGVVCISIAWEIMEWLIGFQRETNHFVDTSIDLAMDLFGGALGFALARAVTGPAHEHTSAPHAPGSAQSTDGA